MVVVVVVVEMVVTGVVVVIMQRFYSFSVIKRYPGRCKQIVSGSMDNAWLNEYIVKIPFL